MSIQRLGNRLAIVIFSSFFVVLEQVGASAVVGILLAFCVSCIGLYTVRRRIVLVVAGCYVLASVGYPTLILIYPVIIYELMDLWRDEAIHSWAVGMFVFMAVMGLLHVGDFSTPVIVGELLVMMLAIWQNITGYQYESVRERLVTTRDDSTELEIKLKHENQFLLEKQDSDIYAATLKERNRIAREIHDNVGHMLSRAILMTGALLAVSKEEGMKEGLRGLKDCLDEAMTDIRESVHDLHDESVDLEQEVRNLMKDMEGYQLRLEYDMSKHIPREIKYCILAIVKESLSNIMKHSSGDCVQIILVEHPSFYKLSVEDNGCCDAGDISAGGIGLYNIKDRVESLSGTWNITAEKTGFQVYVSLPKQIEMR